MQAGTEIFDYLAVLFSIIVGLAVTELLQNLRGHLMARDRVLPFWPAFARAAALLLILAQVCWATFGLRNHADWTFSMYAAILLQIVVLYLVTALALPFPEPEGKVDMKADYFAHASPFYLLFAAAVGASLLKDFALDGEWPGGVNLAFHIGFIGMALAASASKREWLHKIVTASFLILFVAYIATLFDRLPM